MTNETSYAPIKYVCNGITVDFTFPWKIFEEKDLIVQAQGESGLLRELTLGLDYSVEFDEVGGNVKLNQAYAEGYLVVISRNVSDYQSKSYSTSSGFQSSEIEDSFDRVSCNLQEMEYNIENFKEVFSQTVNQEIDVLEGVIEENKQEVLVIQERFEDEVNAKIQEVSEAAGKINALEQAVLDAQTSADNAQASANEALTQKEDLISQGEKLVEDVSKEVARVEDAIEELDKNIDKVINHVSFNLFDTKTTDHILQGEQAKGWAMQGTYVSGALYPDFYNKCLEEKNSATETETTLADGALTMFVNANGHQFYDISNKTIVDAFYDTYGIADFYGIDEENQRIFLPRNKYFAIKGSVDTIPVYGNGMTLGLTDGTNNYGLQYSATNTDQMLAGTNQYGTNVGTAYNNANKATNTTLGITTDPTKSGVIADTSNVVQPNENKYLYYCVGNTVVTQAITNVTEISTSENDTIPLFTGIYFDFKPNNVSWLKAGEQQNSAGIYKTCYDTLVEIVNGVNNYDLKVINQADMVSGVVYDEYWILDQDNLTFRTPLAIATKSLSGGVAGNGISLGLTNGSQSGSMVYMPNSQGYTAITDTLGQPIGTNATSAVFTANKTVGVVSDPTKSGIVVEQSTAQLYFKVANAVQNLELLDAGEVLEAVADKIGRQDCPAYIVETYQNGTSWYRIWSDGWCEQGGYNAGSSNPSSVTFLKEFKDTNYSLVGQSLNLSDYYFVLRSEKTTTGFTASIRGSNSTAKGAYSWEAKGSLNRRQINGN